MSSPARRASTVSPQRRHGWPTAAVDGEAAGDAGHDVAAAAAEVRPQHLGGHVDEADGVGLRELGDAGERAQLPGPQHLAAEDVADTAEHARVEQHLGDAGVEIVVGPQQLDAAVQVGVGAPEIGADAAEAGVALGVGHAVRLDDGGVEAHRPPALDLDQRRAGGGAAPASSHRCGRRATTRSGACSCAG